MSMRIECPEGHPVRVDVTQLGGTATCPRCGAVFPIEVDFLSAQARDEGKSRRRPDDDDDDDEDDRPQKKSKAKDDDLKDKIQELPRKKAPAKRAKADDDDDDAPPRKKTSAKSRYDDDDEDDDDVKPRGKKSSRRDDDEDDEADEPADDADGAPPEEPIVWTPRKRQLKVVRVALLSYQVSAVAMLVMFILDAVGGVVSFIMAFIAIFTGDHSIFLFTQAIFAILMGVGATTVFVSMLIAWIIGAIFSPARSDGKSISQMALGFFALPALFFIFFLIFKYTLITRDLVAANLLNMVLGFSALSWLIALYCGLVYIGRIAGFMGRHMDARKPQALGWFIIGGYLARIIGGVAIVIMLILAAMTGLMPLLIILGIIAFNWWAFYFVITSLLELIEVLVNTRKDIDTYIRDA